jgi:holo-[acyl-carrier protein] synthase
VKEACRKACNHFGKSNGLHHIMVIPASSNGTSSAPIGLVLRNPLHPLLTDPEKGIRVQLRGADRSIFHVNTVEGQFCEISITHDAGIAQAVAMMPTITWSGDSVQGAIWKNAENHDGWAMDLELQDDRPV